MSEEEKSQVTRRVINKFYQLLLVEKDTKAIIELLDEKVEWFIPGDSLKAPWTGKRYSKEGVEEFFKILSEHVLPVKLEIDTVFSLGEKGVVTGLITSKILRNGYLFKSIFAAGFHVKNGKIISYYLLEDGYKLSKNI